VLISVEKCTEIFQYKFVSGNVLEAELQAIHYGGVCLTLARWPTVICSHEYVFMCVCACAFGNRGRKESHEISTEQTGTEGWRVNAVQNR
jgi:hypothetical protein